tara:strand:- start:557 stop:733 length:177 start_codon:yes stop_codon:yes gene_type:complete
MVEYENKMAKTSVKDVVTAIVTNSEPEIEVRRGKYRIRKNGQLLKFDTKEEAEEALAE